MDPWIDGTGVRNLQGMSAALLLRLCDIGFKIVEKSA